MLGSTQGKHSVSNSISSFGIGAPVTGSGSLVYFLWRGESGLQSPVDILDPFHSATITRAGRPSTVYRKGGHFSFSFFSTSKPFITTREFLIVNSRGSSNDRGVIG